MTETIGMTLTLAAFLVTGCEPSTVDARNPIITAYHREKGTVQALMQINKTLEKMNALLLEHLATRKG